MFGSKSKNTIDSLIGVSTRIEGDLHFKGGLRIDGEVNGNVLADSGTASMLVISEKAKVTGEIRASHVVVNGEIVGPVYSGALLELQPKANVKGDVHYKALEMHGGAIISGNLTHIESGEPVLKLAASSTTLAVSGYNLVSKVE